MSDALEPKNCWVFAIDTEQYAGNFERDMCAYITGRVGECGVGTKFGLNFYKEVLKEEVPEGVCIIYSYEDLGGWTNIKSVADEHGCHRPCAIIPTPGWFNNGMGGIFKNGENEKAKKDYAKKCKDYGDRHFFANDPEAQKKHKERWYEKAKEDGGIHHAYLSVGIYFSSPPTEEQIAIMKERTYKFVEIAEKDSLIKQKIKITGFRLIKNETTYNEEIKWSAE